MALRPCLWTGLLLSQIKLRRCPWLVYRELMICPERQNKLHALKTSSAEAVIVLYLTCLNVRFRPKAVGRYAWIAL